MLFADLLSLHLVKFLMFFTLDKLVNILFYNIPCDTVIMLIKHMIQFSTRNSILRIYGRI